MPKRIINRKSLIVLTILIIELTYFVLVNPLNSQTILLFLGILFIIFDYFIILYNLINYFSKISDLVKKRKRKLIVTLTFLGGILIMLGSLGQLSFKDIIVIILLVLLIYWYTWYVMDYGKSS